MPRADVHIAPPTDATPTPREQQVLESVLAALRTLRHGHLHIAVQDGRVVQIDVTEKRRFDRGD